MPSYTTGEMAKLCNVSVRTVQFYDSKGILHPSDLSEGGRRLYNDDDLLKLQLVCTLKAIGLSLSSIKSVLESELSGKILTILLDEQLRLLNDEMSERQRQLEMIQVIKESIHNEAIVSAHIILGIEDIMEKKSKASNKKKLTLIYIAVGVFVATQLVLLAWLITSQIWWALAVYLAIAVLGTLIVVFQLKGSEFICPQCNCVFKPSLRQAYFSVGDHKVRWMTCPECKHLDWCVIRKQVAVE
ncbi:MAG: MerR family transcriptional regulator [Coriobacteriia bacterium]|nr:MerR family transcriptional regulator [Coriobacteriia bacterium]MCL2750314.1 MerR family transcriptional regulator [Coriobacteriia bacterium]